jgi:O-antigen ligase
MFIGIIGALLFLAGLAVAVINLVRKIAKKEPLLPKKIVLLMVGVGFVMFASGIAGDDDPEVASS